MFVFDASAYPQLPGVYIVRNANGKPVYVGKAGNLRRRLASHFADGPDGRVPKHAHHIDTILTRNEHEALVLEDALIKRHRPRLNRARKDDEISYFCIVLTNERPPRLLPYRKNRRNVDLDNARTTIRHTFGPYTSRRYRDTLLTLVANRFGLRTCEPVPKKTCLRFDLGACTGICERRITDDEYEANVRRAVRFLRQPPAKAVAAIERDMTNAAQAQQFELAHALKQQLEALRAAAAKQAVETEQVQRAQATTLVYIEGDDAIVVTIERGTVVDLAHVAAHTVEQTTAKRVKPTDDLADLCRINLAYATGRRRGGAPAPSPSITSSKRRTSSRGGTPFSK